MENIETVALSLCGNESIDFGKSGAFFSYFVFAAHFYLEEIVHQSFKMHQDWNELKIERDRKWNTNTAQRNLNQRIETAVLF